MSIVRWAWLGALLGCAPPPHLLVVVQDPLGLAEAATTLAYGVELGEMQSVPLGGKPWPVSLVFTAQASGTESRLWVDARTADGVSLARARAALHFTQAKGNKLVLSLRQPCEVADSDGAACALPDGRSTGICVSASCVASSCGDGFLDARNVAAHPLGEECDHGVRNSATAADACRLDCRLSRCGDGVIDRVELCDDGNDLDNDGCLSVTSAAPCEPARCGDGIVRAGIEECDDGNALTQNDGCVTCRQTSYSARLVVGAVTTVGAQLGVIGALAMDRRETLYFIEGSRISRLTADGYYGPFGGSTTLADRDSAHVAHTTFVANDLTTDRLGNVFILTESVVLRVDASTGHVSTVAGKPGSGYLACNPPSDPCGDGGPALEAEFKVPNGLGVDGLGNLYIADAFRIRMVEADSGLIHHIAGTGNLGSTGDGGPALDADLAGYRLKVDSQGRIYWIEADYERVRRLYRPAGQTSYQVERILDVPVKQVALDNQDRLYVLTTDDRLWRWDDPTLTLIAGSTPCVDATPSGDSGPALQAVLCAQDFMIGRTGDIYLNCGRRIRRIGTDGIIETVAGEEATFAPPQGASATSIPDLRLGSAAYNGAGVLHFTELSGATVQRINSATGTLERVAGTGVPGPSTLPGPAGERRLDDPSGLVFDAAGNLYIADFGNRRVVRIDAVTQEMSVVLSDLATFRLTLDTSGLLWVLVDNAQVFAYDPANPVTPVHTIGAPGPCDPACAGEGDLANEVVFTSIYAFDVDASGNVYVASDSLWKVNAADWRLSLVLAEMTTNIRLDQARNRLYLEGLQRIDMIALPQTELITVIGTGALSDYGDGGPGAQATLSSSPDVLVVAGDTLLFGNPERLRHFDVVADRVTTVAGGVDPPGDGAFTLAHMSAPHSLALLDTHTLWVADRAEGRIRALDLQQQLQSTTVGYSSNFATGEARYGRVLAEPAGLVFDAAAGVLYVSEATGHCLRAIQLGSNAATITDFAGNCGFAHGHADGVGLAARFDHPEGLALDTTRGLLYVADSGSHVLRVINLATQAVTTLAGKPFEPGYGTELEPTAEGARFFGPSAVAVGSDGSLYVADTKNHRVRRLAPGAAGVPQPDSPVETLLGDGAPRFPDDTAQARTATVEGPSGLWVAPATGDLAVVSQTAVSLLLADSQGRVDGDSPLLGIYGGRQRASLPASVTSCLLGITGQDLDTLYVTDACAGAVIELKRSLVNP